MVFHEKPVAHVLAVAVDGDGPALEGGQDDDRNELLRQLIRAVVVGAVADENRQTERPVPRACEVIGGGLARRIGRAGLVRRGVGEDAFRAERAVNFVGGDVEKPEALPLFALQTVPVLGCGLEQRHRPLHVGGDEVHGTVDGAIDVRFRGKVKHRIRPGLGEDPPQGVAVADVGLLETVVWRIESRLEGFDVPGIGQQVQGRDPLAELHQPPRHTGAYEACPAGQQYPFHASLTPGDPALPGVGATFSEHCPRLDVGTVSRCLRRHGPNGLASSESLGCPRSLSESTTSSAGSGHWMPSAGSFHRSPLSCSGEW